MAKIPTIQIVGKSGKLVINDRPNDRKLWHDKGYKCEDGSPLVSNVTSVEVETPKGSGGGLLGGGSETPAEEPSEPAPAETEAE